MCSIFVLQNSHRVVEPQGVEEDLKDGVKIWYPFLFLFTNVKYAIILTSVGIKVIAGHMKSCGGLGAPWVVV